MQPTLAYIENLARQAGAILRAGYNTEHQVGYKGVIDLVTEVDHQSEAYLLGEVQRDFPEHPDAAGSRPRRNVCMSEVRDG